MCRTGWPLALLLTVKRRSRPSYVVVVKTEVITRHNFSSDSECNQELALALPHAHGLLCSSVAARALNKARYREIIARATQYRRGITAGSGTRGCVSSRWSEWLLLDALLTGLSNKQTDQCGYLQTITRRKRTAVSRLANVSLA